MVSISCLRLLAGVFLAVLGAASTGHSLFSPDNLVAWCIVPFDAKHRSPEERAAMLKRLGISKLAYDWRDKDIPDFDRELDALTGNGIKLHAFWLTAGPDPASEKNVGIVLDFLKRRGVRTEIWFLFTPPKGFDGMEQQQKLASAAGAVRYLTSETDKIGCSIGLYNHGGWFGEPKNQIEIIKQVGARNVGIVYNFHHGRTQMDRFPDLFVKMLPYLKAVNVNGMRKDAPMILPVGDGDQELEMLRIVERSSYRGPIGILGHREDQDAEVSLSSNLRGLEKLVNQMRGTSKTN